MLIIRREQMEAFSRAAMAAFETEMVAHCNGFSPRLCEVIGEAQLRVAIGRAIDRARIYGISNRGPVRLFIEMTFLFGGAFDTDPQYPWAAEILGKPESGSQMERAERLFEKALDYLEKVAGPEDQFTWHALERISELARRPPPLLWTDLIPSVRRITDEVYPEKAAYVGHGALEGLLREAIDQAAAHGMTAARDAALLHLLMLAFGHGCTDDPLYPWIARALKDDRIADPAGRATRLENKAKTWLGHVLRASPREGGPQS